MSGHAEGRPPPELPCCRAGPAGEQSSCGGADHLSPGVPSVRGRKSAGAFQQPRYVPHGRGKTKSRGDWRLGAGQQCPEPASKAGDGQEERLRFQGAERLSCWAAGSRTAAEVRRAVRQARRAAAGRTQQDVGSRALSLTGRQALSTLVCVRAHGSDVRTEDDALTVLSWATWTGVPSPDVARVENLPARGLEGKEKAS
ncbi:hypothetical protein R6Z07F_010165 [Ovis aries]